MIERLAPGPLQNAARLRRTIHGHVKSSQYASEELNLMDWMLYVIAGVFTLLGVLCMVLVVLQLPGTWILIALAVVIELTDTLYLSGESPQTFGWWWIAACAALAGVGELIEFAAGAIGAGRGGATRRGMIGAVIGGIAGAIALTPIIPIPLLGTLIGALIGTFLGALVGEVTGEMARTTRDSIKPALAATIGRILGTTGKVAFALVVLLVLTVGAWWP